MPSGQNVVYHLAQQCSYCEFNLRCSSLGQLAWALFVKAIWKRQFHFYAFLNLGFDNWIAVTKTCSTFIWFIYIIIHVPFQHVFSTIVYRRTTPPVLCLESYVVYNRSQALIKEEGFVLGCWQPTHKKPLWSLWHES